MKNKLYQSENKIIRILDCVEDEILVIDCVKQSMPVWAKVSEIEAYIPCTDVGLFEVIGNVPDIESLESDQIRAMHERYTMIAGVLPYIGNVKLRSCRIVEVARANNISKQTVRNYLCKYLTYMDILALAPKKKDADRELSSFEKNIRWGLNKFFYSQKRNS